MSNSADGTLEIQISPTSGYAASGEKTVARAKQAFQTLGDLLEDAIQPFREKVKNVDEMEIGMNISLKGESKWVIVSASAEASVHVKLTWKAGKTHDHV